MLDRLSSSQEDLESEELREDAETTGCTKIGDCRDRLLVTVTGTVRTVSLRPRAGGLGAREGVRVRHLRHRSAPVRGDAPARLVLPGATRA